ncbi:MAG: hypothetical protein WCT51_04925 [Candidatus Shapirobacteria bacterium]|jgi:hypothetical protein
MLKDKFIPERWNKLSNELKMAVAIKLLEKMAYFSNIVKETGITSTEAHTAQNRLMDLGYIQSDGGNWIKFETSWKKVPTIINKSENEFLDKLIPELFIK